MSNDVSIGIAETKLLTLETTLHQPGSCQYFDHASCMQENPSVLLDRRTDTEREGSKTQSVGSKMLGSRLARRNQRLHWTESLRFHTQYLVLGTRNQTLKVPSATFAISNR